MPGGEHGGRVLDFSLGAAHLSMRHDQLVVRRDGMPEVTMPLSETAVVVISSRQVTCTLPLLDGLMRHGASLVVCDETMLPSGMMLPLDGHHQQTRRMIAQATASQPRRKRLWQQIIRAKIMAQGAMLEVVHADDFGFYALARRVRSGDPDNLESQAAQRYWSLLFNDPEFRRKREAADQNRLLNYGYAVLRAAVGRAVCGAGLHPSLGLFHRGRGNAFCLADDLMEPYRPLVDGEVREIVGELGRDAALMPPIKQRLVGILHERLKHDREQRTVLDWLARSASSLARCICGEEMDLFFPEELMKP